MRTLLLLLAFTVSLSAELPPEAYRDMQRRAPEVLQVEIVNASVRPLRSQPRGCSIVEFEITNRVVAQARVLAVARSASGVRRGDVIAIAYESVKHCDGWAGPGPAPILRKGDRVYAFITKNGDRFALAAMGQSFQKTMPRL